MRSFTRNWDVLASLAVVGVLVGAVLGSPQERGGRSQSAQDRDSGDSKAGDAPRDGAARANAHELPVDSNGRVVKTDAEWRRLLSRDAYYITRQKGTEPAFTGKYARGKHTGLFRCIACGAPLFSSKHKFESGTGWPSFWQPVSNQALVTADDFSNPFEARVEVVCARCDAHLGHVFPDGPPPTGLRYCINSVALKLTPFEGESDAAGAGAAGKKGAAKKKAASKPAQDRTADEESDGAPVSDKPRGVGTSNER